MLVCVSIATKLQNTTQTHNRNIYEAAKMMYEATKMAYET
jgi:hypothetical protein